jgi:tetratricopeptide (TPR) repeat protein
MRAAIAMVACMFCGTVVYAQIENALNKKALGFMEVEKYDEALAILNKLVDEYPSVTAYRYNRAVTFFGLGQYSKSIADYEILFNEDKNSEYVFQIGNAYEQMDSLTQSASCYTRAIELEGDQYLTFFKRGTVYLKMKNFSKAIDDFTSAIKLNPEHGNSFHNRGIALYQSKMQGLACEDWCRAQQLGNVYSEEHLKINCKKSIPAPCK